MKIKHYILIGLLVFLLFPIFPNTPLTIKPAQAQTSPVIYTSGSGTFNVPAGATDLVIEVWGGGGGGAGSINTNGVGSAGGGGGGYAKKTIASPASSYTYSVGTGGTGGPTSGDGATVEIPGVSPISKDNQVMTYTGEVADNTVNPGSELAPKSTSLESKAELPTTAISLDVSYAGFSPNTFTVDSNNPVTLAITSVDDRAHVLMFDDPSLKAVKFGVISGETRAMTFAAPSTPGTYTFFCEVPNHKDRGEVGTMVVR